jgi:hypothetical protein
MSVVTSKCRFRVVLICLLVIFVSGAATTTRWIYGWDDSGAELETALFTSILGSSAAPVLANEQRTQLTYFENLLKVAATHPKIPIIFALESSAFLSEYETAIFHSTDRTAIPTRAPPCLHSC